MNALALQPGALETLRSELKLQWLLAAFSIATATASIAWDSAMEATGGPGGWEPRPALLALSASALLASRD